MIDYDFRQINFGLSDAQTEGEDYPNLLSDGYVDILQVVDKAINTSVFLFLGYKGSGKSSLSEHLRLTQVGVEVDQQPLKDFPFKFFDKIINSEDRNFKYKTIWRWLLCTKVLSSMCSTLSDNTHCNKETENAIKVFTQLGLFPVLNISSLVKRTSNTTVSATLKSLGISHSVCENYAEADMEMLTDYIKMLICSIKENKPRLIIIDELDDILTPNGRQFENIAALIKEVKDLNSYFRRNNILVKILILCRTDMFERLPGQNLNKIKQDNSFTFTWYREGVNCNVDSDLIHLVNKRARLTYPDLQDVFSQFFPKKYDDTDIYNALLNYTRHTPRDFVQLMNSIKNHCNDKIVSPNAISKAIKEYSMEYFKQEISNELAGYFTGQAIEAVFNALSSIRRQKFTYQQFVKKCQSYPTLEKVEPFEIMRVLYDCSAIGHTHYYKENGSTRVLFKYRNRVSTFNPNDKILLHRGLWKALNVSL